LFPHLAQNQKANPFEISTPPRCSADNTVYRFELSIVETSCHPALVAPPIRAAAEFCRITEGGLVGSGVQPLLMAPKSQNRARRAVLLSPMPYPFMR